MVPSLVLVTAHRAGVKRARAFAARGEGELTAYALSMASTCTLALTVPCGAVAFIAVRRFERVKLLQDPPSEAPVCKLGFDPLTGMVPLHEFAATMRARSGPVKGGLLDQAFCAGVGNWIADEVLYQARVHPETSCAALSDTQVAALHHNLSHVVTTACSADAESDNFPADWLFHFRWTGKKASKTADGHAIAFATVASRTTAFVPALQKKTDGDRGRKVHASSAAQKAEPARGRAAGGAQTGGEAAVRPRAPGKQTGTKRKRGVHASEDKALAGPVEVEEATKKRTRTGGKRAASGEGVEVQVGPVAGAALGGATRGARVGRGARRAAEGKVQQSPQTAVRGRRRK